MVVFRGRWRVSRNIPEKERRTGACSSIDVPWLLWVGWSAKEPTINFFGCPTASKIK